jgi:cobalt/nickel transport system permease protein
MHLPDGILDLKTAAVSAAFSAVGLGFALRQVRRELPARKVPLLGLAAAFLFAAQMVNFPVAGGTSGHLVGGTLVAALLGPGAAIVVLTSVLIVQCFLFQDGGVLALGANVFNMAIVNSVAGYFLYRAVSRCLPGVRGRVTALVFAAWFATVLAAVCCAAQLAWSGKLPWSVAFPAMAGVHILIGIGEGLISALVFLAVERTRPEMISDSGAPGQSSRAGSLVRHGLLATFGIVVFVAPFACTWPDGLESVAAKFGFAPAALRPLLPAPAPDYQVPGIHWAVGATALAGAIGAPVVFGLALMVGKWLVPRTAQASANTPRDA